MLFSILILLAWYSQSMMGLKCMMKDKTPFSFNLMSTPCTFTLSFGDAFPDTVSLKKDHGCEQEEFSLPSILLAADQKSCFASVKIDYSAKTMEMQFNGVAMTANLDPYDDMLPKYPAEDFVAQFKMEGNFPDQVQLTVRVQCKGDDDCATELLRQVLPHVFEPVKQMDTFSQLNSLLNDASAMSAGPFT